MQKRFKEIISVKNLKMEMLFFDLLVAKIPSIIIHVGINDILHNVNHENIQKQLFSRVKIGVLKNFANFTLKYLRWSLFLIKLQAFKRATLFKRDSSTGVFCEICKLFKNVFFSGDCFWILHAILSKLD